jgi:protein involved in polysaccharide export with SLBB domain
LKGTHRPGLLLAFLGVGLALLALPAAAQDETPELPDEDTGIFGEGATADAPDAEGLDAFLVDEGEGLEAAISGSEYRLGPGDVLAVSILGPQPTGYRLVVTLEGKLLIPSVGELPVNNLFLSEAKEKVRAAILRNYRNVEVSVTLVQLRRFQVHVLGQVRAPGTFQATAVHRVSYAVSRARGFLRDASQRRILVQSGDSLRAEADLYSFLKRGIVDRNPLLRDGDKIYVPFSQYRFRVLGQVNEPGEIQYLEGDRFSDALLLAGGLGGTAYVDTVELARYAPGAADPRRYYIIHGGGIVAADPEGAASVPVALGVFRPDTLEQGPRTVYSDFELQPDDVVFVRNSPEFRLRKLVEIQGEVLFPGSYPFEQGKTRISDLVRMAGGPTKDAFLPESRLIRRDNIGLRDPEFERLKKISVADMEDEEYAYFKARSREVPGQMVVDFEKAVNEEDPGENILLNRGDLVVVPQRKNYVTVLGTVGRPGNVTFKPGLTARDYVDLAGGFARDADKGESRVIKSNGEWLTFGKAGGLNPGDVVFVPDEKPGKFWDVFRSTLTVTAQILTIYLVADRALE